MTVPAQVLAAVRSIPHPRQETDMTAPHPSPAEQAVIDRFGIFEPEELRERVAKAIGEAEREHVLHHGQWCSCGWKVPEGDPAWLVRAHEHRLRTTADAAIAAINGGQS